MCGQWICLRNGVACVRLWHKAQQGSNLVSGLYPCLSLSFEDSHQTQSPSSGPQKRKRQLGDTEACMPLTPDSCFSPGSGQGWNRNNSPRKELYYRHCEKELLVCLGDSKVHVPLQKKRTVERGGMQHSTLQCSCE